MELDHSEMAVPAVEWDPVEGARALLGIVWAAEAVLVVGSGPAVIGIRPALIQAQETEESTPMTVPHWNSKKRSCKTN